MNSQSRLKKIKIKNKEENKYSEDTKNLIKEKNNIYKENERNNNIENQRKLKKHKNRNFFKKEQGRLYLQKEKISRQY